MEVLQAWLLCAFITPGEAERWTGLHYEGKIPLKLYQELPAVPRKVSSSGGEQDARKPRTHAATRVDSTLRQRCHLLWILHRAFTGGKRLKDGGIIGMDPELLTPQPRKPKARKLPKTMDSCCVPFITRKLTGRGDYKQGVFSVDRSQGGRRKWRLSVSFQFDPTGPIYKQSVSRLLCFLRHGQPPNCPYEAEARDDAEGAGDRCGGECAMHVCERSNCLHPRHIRWAPKALDIKGWRTRRSGPRVRLGFVNGLRARGKYM